MAKLSGLIVLMLTESVRLSDGSTASRTVEFIFGVILYLLPDNSSFAQSDIFFENAALLPMLGEQLFSVAIYAGFLIAVCLFDFYRKEFNL